MQHLNLCGPQHLCGKKGRRFAFCRGSTTRDMDGWGRIVLQRIADYGESVHFELVT
ncbi:hypothetical protein B0H19DRAFT_1196302 [Mycena capillaripes]|nr:hypothetical protein B0H19DRAFT_1196302 [Mycena capillaripes]